LKYLLEVPVKLGNIHRQYYYQPGSILLNAPPDFVRTQEEAYRFDSEEDARAALDVVVIRLKELYAPADPMGALSGFQYEMRQVRENAKVIPVPIQYVVRTPIHHNGRNAFDYYQSEAIHILPSGREFKVSFGNDVAKAIRFASTEEAFSAIPEAVEKYQGTLRACCRLTEEEILERGEHYRSCVEVVQI
jgi:hypothetical protein